MTTLEIIKTYFNNQCNYQHINCRDIANKISLFHSQGNKVTNNFLTSYLLYLENGSQYYYDKCINQKQIWIPVIKQIFNYLIPTDDDLIILTKIQEKIGYSYGYFLPSQ